MSKFAVEIIEVLSRTVISEGDTYEEAEAKVKRSVKGGSITLNEENSHYDFDYKNDTANYIEIFGDEKFQSFPETDELVHKTITV